MSGRKPRHAVYLLPNAFTTAALFFGFVAVVEAVRGDWQGAAMSVVIAALLDACDGRIARWTGTQSAFGAEYDSLADAVSFGVAPALIAYQWSLSAWGKLGLCAAFCYCAAAALRLARFNAQSGGADRRFFIGIPSPAAALLIVSFVATMDAWDFHGAKAAPYAAAMCFAAALTMVSGVRYYSFKELNIRRRRVPFRHTALFFAAAAAVYALADTFMELLLALLGAYFVSGYIYAAWTGWKYFTRKRKAPGN
ncbi:MAG: CDP-diacylglycerol--serine O-phosphatidyltransferase [Gammaproteobacteria bacterium]